MSAVKNVFLVVGGLTLLAICIFMFAPEQRIEAVKSEFRRLSNDPGQLCFDFHSEKVKDARSAQIKEVVSGEEAVEVKFRAMNEFGAYGIESFSCPLSEGRFDLETAETVEALARMRVERDQTLERIMEIGKEVNQLLDEPNDVFMDDERYALWQTRFHQKAAQQDRAIKRHEELDEKIAKHEEKLK